jgi:hypothetical protein
MPGRSGSRTPSPASIDEDGRGHGREDADEVSRGDAVTSGVGQYAAEDYEDEE